MAISEIGAAPIVVKSPFHSKWPEQANGRRKLVITPDSNISPQWGECWSCVAELQSRVMSFDLFFCWNRHERIDFEAVCSWSDAFGCFKRNDNQLWYSNEDTGVYFSLDFEPKQPSEGESPEIPEGYFDTGLSFNLNFNRPSYFGYEAMPVVENLCKSFALFASDPQARDLEHQLLRDVNSHDLLEGWLENNRNAILTMIEHADLETPPQMLLEKSTYRWNYSNKRKELQRKCGEQMFVPTLSPIRRRGSSQVQLAFAYTQNVPCLVPDSDWVLVVRNRKAHLWSAAQSEVGILSARRFRELVSRHLENFDSSEGSLQVLSPKATSDVNRHIQNCEFEYPKEEFEVLPPDGFVDIEIGPGNSPN
jgi:hypothetical protein